MFGPSPQVGRLGNVALDGVPLMLVDGSYSVKPAPRISPSISQGQVLYPSFNPQYESPWEITDLSGGYGLRRYADRLGRTNAYSQLDYSRRQMYLETSGVDCRFAGQVVLAPRIARSATELSSAPIWIGDVQLSGVLYLVVVAGTQVFTVNPSTLDCTLVITLPATPASPAIGAFGARLVFGYGAARTAQYTADLATLNNVTNTAAASLYAWAFASDHSAAFIAGGPTTSDYNKVTSSTDGGTGYDTTLTKAGDGQTNVTSLLPGGGGAQLFVLKEAELGGIDNANVYHTLVPFGSRDPINGMGARWWLGTGDDQQRGPVVIFFPRDRGLWSYQPSSDNAGTAQNVSPWAVAGIHPLTARGRVTAIQGSARWLYYVVQNNAGNAWLVAKDSRTTADHTLLSLGANACSAMTLNSPGVTPKLIFGNGTRIAAITLPVDGESPYDNAGMSYALTGTLTLPEIEWDLPDEQKVLASVRVAADNLVPASRFISVEMALDGGAFQAVGSADLGPAQDIVVPQGTTCKRLQLRLTLHTDDTTQTPLLRAVVVRATINATTYRVWEFKAKAPAGSLQSQTDETGDWSALSDQFWSALSDGTAVAFTDRWGDDWLVRLIGYEEHATIQEATGTPENQMAFQLLELSALSGKFRWDAATSLWDASTSGWR